MPRRRARVPALLAVVMVLARLDLAHAEEAEPEPADVGGRLYGEIPEPESLSEQLFELRSLIGRTRIGGWVDLVVKDTDEKGQRPFIDPHHFYLYFDNRLNESWQAFAELEIEHAVELAGGSGDGVFKLDRLYIQWNHSDPLHLRGGKYGTRFGYWTPIHWAISMDTVEAPIHDDNQYVPRRSVGIEAFGTWFPSSAASLDAEIGYSAFFSNGSEIAGTNKPKDGRLGGGLDLRALFQEKYLIGASYYQQRNPSPKVGVPGRKEDSLMLYSDLRLPGGITLRGEYMHQFRGSGDSDVDVGYGKIKWNFLTNAYLNYRFGRGDDDKLAAGERHTAHAITVGYHPLPQVRIKLEYSRHEFANSGAEDFNAGVAWIGYVF